MIIVPVCVSDIKTFQFTCFSDNAGQQVQDLAGATCYAIFRDPLGNFHNNVGTVSSVVSGTYYYTTQQSDLNVTGAWTLTGRVVISGTMDVTVTPAVSQLNVSVGHS